jgi:tRNA threonylcarbamoyladenosine biosynthesis protein TsaB
MILNIETSETTCSVAITHEGELLYQLIEEEPMQHAVKLALFVDKAMNELRRREHKLEAVAVSIGPGSYTGLRIGLSTAKGICMGLDIPLIGVSTLEAWAVKAMFTSNPWAGEEVLIPMMDARRMEVYTAAYDFALNHVITPGPLILDADSYSQVPEDKKLIIFGSGMEKTKKAYEAGELLQGRNPQFLKLSPLVAADMMALSEKALREQKFIDLAYSTPQYLKEFQATTPKNILGNK